MIHRGLVAIALGITLSGCATYSTSAVPAAGQAYKLAMDRCSANQPNMHNVSEAMECIIAADRQMAVDIRLRRMDMFESYAARLRLLASQADAKAVTPDEMAKRYTEIRADYFMAIEQSQENGRRQAEAFSAGLAAAGQSMQREADRQAYIQAHQPRPMNCNSTAIGNQVQTTCN